MSDTTASWPVLTARERRILGVLIEKAKTTPDAYPLSLNALTTGCNQKSNRDPLMNLHESEVEEVCYDLQQRGLIEIVAGGRVDRWRHLLYDKWTSHKVELAILAELLLRGAQTEGELRTRASRMEDIQDLDELRRILRPMAERKMIVYLTPEHRRGTILTHGFSSPEELHRLRLLHAGSATGDEPPAAIVPRAVPSAPSSVPPLAPLPAQPALSALEAQVAQLRGEIDLLKREMLESRAEIARLTQTVSRLQAELGMMPPPTNS